MVAGLLLASVSIAEAQETSYAQHDYMKVPSGQAQAYLDLEQELWKPIHRERAQDETIEGWNLYEVVYPAGAERSYDYVTVSFYDAWSRLESPYAEEHLTNAHPNMDPQEIAQRTVQSRSLVRSEVVEVVAKATGEETASDDAQYVAVDYMRVPEGGASDYVQAEQELWKPIHQELIERTSQTGWFVVELQFEGAEAPYQYMTIRPFADWAYLDPAAETGSFQAAFDAVHPDRSIAEVAEQTSGTRTIVRREVWRLVDSVAPED